MKQFPNALYQVANASYCTEAGLVKNDLEPFTFIRKHLTGFARLLARHRPRGGLYDHKWAVTMSNERANPAFGAPEQPTSGVSQLARCAAPDTFGRCADCLAG